MKKYICIIVTFVILLGCTQHSSRKSYDFNALRDSLNLKDDCIFIEECSPLYSDDNPNNLPDENARVKTIFYQVIVDSLDSKVDTVIHAVLRDNQIIFWGRNEVNGSAKELIEWTINNRDKI